MPKPVCKLCERAHFTWEPHPPDAVSQALAHLRAQGFALPREPSPTVTPSPEGVTEASPSVTRDVLTSHKSVTPSPPSVTPQDQVRAAHRERQRRYRERRGDGDGT